jgi:phage terminase large subunit-like protein
MLDAAELQRLAATHAASVLDRVEARYHGRDDVYFDAATADRAEAFFPRFLRHSIGSEAGQPFHLLPWQARTVRAIFGWKWRASGLRVIRRVYLFVARKNGKSTFAAGLALLLLVGKERSGQVLSAAALTEQAGIVFGEAARMVAASPGLSREVEVFKGHMECAALGSVYRVLSGRPRGKHGLNPHALLFDELHEQSTRDLYDAMTTAVGARAEPLEIYMTTAGYDRHSICAEVDDYARRVRDGVIDDLAFLPLLFEADEKDDPFQPEAWAKANPSLGYGVRLEFLEREAKTARDVPARLNTFLRLHLNRWTQQSSKAIDPDAWRACAGPTDWKALREQLRGRRCYGGMDLAKVDDLSAFVLVFPPTRVGEPVHVLPWFWCPRADIERRERQHGASYLAWQRADALVATPGNVTDFAFIRKGILDAAQLYQIQEIGFDRTFAGEIVQELQAEGLAMVQVGQGFISMAAPTAEILRLVKSQGLAHGGHPVLTWCADNLQVVSDPAGNLKPDKAQSGDKIDGISALANALARSLVAGDAVPQVMFL